MVNYGVLINRANFHARQGVSCQMHDDFFSFIAPILIAHFKPNIAVNIFDCHEYAFLVK
jgi:hypothetical protein